jgi:carboxypeptidase T
MRWLSRIPILLFLIHFSTLQSQTKWQAANILLEGKSIQSLLNLGIALDHGHYHPGESFHGDFTTEELERIHAAGFKIDITSYQKHPISLRNAPGNCEINQDEAPVYPLPSYYEFGSQNGFLSLSEIYESLELMEALYPNLITVKKPISNTRTVDNNLIYYVKISDNPNIDEDEPEVLFTALHHAREPLSMSQMMFFMWHLLENYSRDTNIAKLVNNRELFFIPCLNPDGYLFNESTDPSGGGMWRKNRNPNLDGIGTDLNRNYDEGWAYDNDGSSPLGTSETYRGISPFSEVETKNLSRFIEGRNFVIAMNYHSHGNKLIIPWGYLDKPTEDSAIYISMADEMTRYNNFEVGTSTQTLAYKVNGVADDWMYGEQLTKNKIFAFTPEVGYGFWPQRKDIIQLNQSTQYMNFMAAWNAGECAHVKEKSPFAVSSDTNYLDLQVSRNGLQQAPIKIQLQANKAYIRFLDNNLNLSLNAGESRLLKIPYVIDGNAKRGDSIQFTLQLNTGLYSESVKFIKTYTGSAGLTDNFNDSREWFAPTVSPWQLTSESFVSAPHSLTDSQNGPMTPNTIKVFQNVRTIDLRNAKYAFLRFNAKWSMAEDVDFAQIRVADNSLVFQSLCGRYTKQGTFSQQYQEPVYCGKQTAWISEWIDLKDYLGKIIFLQLYLSAGQNAEANDGFYIDDLEIFTDLSTKVLEGEHDWISQVYPQPAHDYLYVPLKENTIPQEVQIQLISASGKPQAIKPLFENNQFKIETSSLLPGFYFLNLSYRNQTPKVVKVVIH